MSTVQVENLFKASDCEVRTDTLTRQLYATDASIYQIEPHAVAFPRSSEQTADVIQAAIAQDVSIIPRGAGTGLAGGAVGSGLVIDFSRHNKRISDFDAEKKIVRVESGVVLDQLNNYLQPRGLRFGPDVATSSRATLGGMIANNSSGSHVRRYGTTIDRVRSLEIALSDGRIVTIGRDHDALSEIHTEVAALISGIETEVDARMPAGLFKRWPGYGFDRWLRHSPDLTKMIGGSEGTLACILSAELELEPLPTRKGLGCICFATVAEAMQATVEILELNPEAIEHIDDVLFDQTKGQLQFKRARILLNLDEQPCESILLVEFFDDIDASLSALEQKKLGLRTIVFPDTEDQSHIWNLRKAGLSLLTGCKGDAKPTAGIEDACILPEKLPDYVEGLRSLMEPLGLRGSFYGHAASGLLHVRPVVDMHKAEDIQKFRQLADGVSALVKQFKGSIAAEHGVGIARVEYLPDHLGPQLMSAVARVKQLFDPDNRMNPGKIIGGDQFRIDGDLRQGEGSVIELPFERVLAFADKDCSFVGNLEQCNGCGGCRKDPPTMCPTYAATGEEIMSTRGRANTIRAAIEGRVGESGHPLASPELEEALSNCLSCKACTTECPSNVNLALLKAELLHAQHRAHGLPLRDRILSRVDRLGELGTRFPALANATMNSGLLRSLSESILGLSAKRPLPAYASQRFDQWFAARQHEKQATRGPVILWDDCFIRYNEPNIGIAAVNVLEAAGFDVVLLRARACCGRPAFSIGRLDLAKEMAEQNVQLIQALDTDAPILFLEPSCFSMLFEDYRELGVPHAADVASRTALFEHFIADLLQREPDAISFAPQKAVVAIHAHCHAKALTDVTGMAALAEAIPELNATLLNTGCCGMAGAFGALHDKYDLSVAVAEPLIGQLTALPEGTRLVASGTSCRHQIEHLHEKTPLHMAELLAGALGP